MKKSQLIKDNSVRNAISELEDKLSNISRINLLTKDSTNNDIINAINKLIKELRR